MCKSLKAIFAGIYLAIFLHSINYLLFYEKNDIVQLNYMLRTPGKIKQMVRKLRKLKNNVTITTSNFKRPKRFHTDLKYILNWNHEPTYRGSNFVKGQTPFLMNNCTYTNCYLTIDKTLLPDFRYFDAILFGVESDWDIHPLLRAYYQNYIFTTSQSARTYPICNEKYDNYYNLTWTYRLDSDIIKSKFKIMDLNANVIGPKKDMLWITKMQPTTDEVKRKLKEKKKAAVWFLNNCAPTSNLIISLNQSLSEVKLTLDSYGWCGKYKCPKNRIEECLLLLKKNYYFYFAFERSIAEDYVTEDLLHPLLNYAVPVVYGGADYSRFLPPGSYIDASKLDTNDIVTEILRSIKNRQNYYDYFRWHNHYTYKETTEDDGICELCAILNSPSSNYKEIKNIRSWWNPDYKDQC